MLTRTFAISVGLLAACCGPAALAQDTTALSAQLITPVTLVLNDERAEFEVVDARMDETATAAVFFGLIGAAVNSAQNLSEDQESAAPLVQTAESLDLPALIRDAAQRRLAERNANLITDAQGAQVFSVEIEQWGLHRRGQAPDENMRAFLNLKVSLQDARGKRIWGPENVRSTGRLHAPIADFSSEVFKAEIEALAERVGAQIANKLIYP